MVDFAKPIGPLPTGAWIALVGGGLGIAWYTSRGRSSSPTIVEDTSGTPGVGDGSQSLWVQTNPPAADPADAPPKTNEEWARKAVTYLIAQGYDASLADTAIRKYLESTPLSLSERALVTLALAKLGPPPILLPVPPDLPTVPTTPPVVTPPPTSTPPPVTVPSNKSGRWVVVQKWPGPTPFDSLWQIAEWAYGRGYLYPRIFAANQRGVVRPDGSQGMLTNPNIIRPGQRLFVPD